MKAETDEHSLIKSLMAGKLNQWFGITITEYPSSGQALDIFSINSKGVTIMIEIIWTDSKMNFFRDMVLLLRSEAQVKIVIAQTSVVQNHDFIREFQKTRISESRKGIIIPEMIDGNRILEESEYVEDYVKRTIMDSLNNFRGQKARDPYIRVSMLPTETSDQIEDVSLAQLQSYLDRIKPGSGGNIRIEPWNDLERVARSKRIWKIPQVWEKLSNEILCEDPALGLNVALNVLKRMLLTSKDDLQIMEVINMGKQLYRHKLEEIMGSTDESWEEFKSDSKQILEFLVGKDECFLIYWNSWKKCMKEIKENNRYTQYIGYFINNLIYAKKENRESILDELYTLMESPEDHVSLRASELHRVMFG